MVFVIILVLSAISCKAQSTLDRLAAWERSAESFDTTLVHKLRAKIGDEAYKEINSIVVIKNGKLLLEEYFNGAHKDLPHDTRSVGKTFASAITGIAMQDGFVKDLGRPLSEFYSLDAFDNVSKKKARVTLRHLLTMSSGFDGNDNDVASPGNEENMYPSSDWVRWTLNLPMATERNPGDRWAYFTAGVVLLGDILNTSLPGGLEQYADEKLFQPLGVANYRWLYTPQGVPNTAGGIRLTPLDLAKFGQLYKNKGRWGKRQVIPEKWVEESLQRHYKTDFQDYYGYLWWNKTYHSSGEEYEVFHCSGNGGNKIFVFPDHPLVVVITASAYNKRFAHRQVDEMMEKYIIPSVIGAERR